MPAPDRHIVDAEELSKIEAIGFVIERDLRLAPEIFINEHFAGFNGFHFLQHIDGLLQPNAVPPTIKKLILSEPPPKLVLIFLSGDLSDTVARLVLKRTFVKENGKLLVTHDYFILPEAVRKQKLGKKVLAACLEEYENMGVAKISVHAGLEDGGFIWAKAGFKAINREEVDVILNAAETRLASDDFDVVKSWYDDHYNNFPDSPFNIEDWAGILFMKDILRGSDWHGEINLTNDEDLINFREYVNR